MKAALVIASWVNLAVLVLCGVRDWKAGVVVCGCVAMVGVLSSLERRRRRPGHLGAGVLPAGRAAPGGAEKGRSVVSRFSLYEHTESGGRRLIEAGVGMPEAEAIAKNREMVTSMRRWWPDAKSSPDVHARTTVGASFVEPHVRDEKLAKRIAAFLVGKVRRREDHVSDEAAADDYARNLTQWLINDYNVTER